PGMMPTRSLMAPAPPPVQMMPPRAAGGADIPVCLEPGADRNVCPTSSGVRQVGAVRTNAPVIRPADAREVGGSIVASSWQPRSFPSRIVPQPAPVELMPPTASGSTTVMGPELQTFTPSDLKVTTPRPERLAAMPNRTDGGDPTALHAPQPAAGVPYAQAGAHGGHDPQAFHGADAPHEGNKQAPPPYMIEPPDVLLIEFTRKDAARPLRGEFLVGPDGMVNLGTYGQVPAGGLTVEQGRPASP